MCVAICGEDPVCVSRTLEGWTADGHQCGGDVILSHRIANQSKKEDERVTEKKRETASSANLADVGFSGESSEATVVTRCVTSLHPSFWATSCSPEHAFEKIDLI
ncbi:uncharacterized [Tachysurus ichikawai]